MLRVFFYQNLESTAFKTYYAAAVVYQRSRVSAYCFSNCVYVFFDC